MREAPQSSCLMYSSEQRGLSFAGVLTLWPSRAPLLSRKPIRFLPTQQRAHSISLRLQGQLPQAEVDLSTLDASICMQLQRMFFSRSVHGLVGADSFPAFGFQACCLQRLFQNYRRTFGENLKEINLSMIAFWRPMGPKDSPLGTATHPHGCPVHPEAAQTKHKELHQIPHLKQTFPEPMVRDTG